MGIDLFFPSTGEPNAPAKAICASCRVSDDCLRAALEFDGQLQVAGIWGGTSELERRTVRKVRA